MSDKDVKMREKKNRIGPLVFFEDNSETWTMTETKDGLEITHSMEEYGSSYKTIPWRVIRAAVKRHDGR